MSIQTQLQTQEITPTYSIADREFASWDTQFTLVTAQASQVITLYELIVTTNVSMSINFQCKDLVRLYFNIPFNQTMQFKFYDNPIEFNTNQALVILPSIEHWRVGVRAIYTQE